VALEVLTTLGEGVGLSTTGFYWYNTAINKIINVKQQFIFFIFKHISLFSERTEVVSFLEGEYGQLQWV
jgi:hypothetical protein